MEHSLPQDRSFLNCCLTGMIPTKKEIPSLPVSIDEIIAESRLLGHMGAGILHIHARDTDGTPTWKKEIYARIISGIRETDSDIIICVSTSGRLWSDFERRSEVLELEGDTKPDMASLTLGSLNFMNGASMNEPSVITDLARKMLDKGIKPELEIFDTGMMNTMVILERKRVLQAPHYANLIFGNIHTMQFDPLLLSFLVDAAPDKTVIGVGGIGMYHFPLIEPSLSHGLGVRVGLEDTSFMDHHKLRPATNRDLAANVLRQFRSAGKTPFTAGEMGKLLKLSRFT